MFRILLMLQRTCIVCYELCTLEAPPENRTMVAVLSALLHHREGEVQLQSSSKRKPACQPLCTRAAPRTHSQKLPARQAMPGQRNKCRMGSSGRTHGMLLTRPSFVSMSKRPQPRQAKMIGSHGWQARRFNSRSCHTYWQPFFPTVTIVVVRTGAAPFIFQRSL
jgi:hypothetical protein